MARVSSRLAAGAAIMLAGAALGDGSHTLAPGDVLEVLAFRVPDLERRVTVGLDGAVVVPPLGRIEAAGHTVDELAREVEARLAADEVLRGTAVSLSLAQVRPVIVGGSVAAPGEVTFRAGLTARGAIALAGGVGRLRDGDALALARLRADRAEAALALSQARLRLRVIEAEIAGEDALPADEPPDSGLGAGLDPGALEAEREGLRARLDEARAERARLDRELAALDEQVRALDQVTALGEEQVARQIEEVDRLRESESRGLTPRARVTEATRVLGDLRRQATEARADRLDARRRRDALAHERDRFDDRRLARLMDEARAQREQVDALALRVDGLSARIAEFGLTGQERPVITVHRTVDGDEVVVPAELSTPLEPGDLLDVTLPEPGLAALGRAGARRADAGGGAMGR